MELRTGQHCGFESRSESVIHGHAQQPIHRKRFGERPHERVRQRPGSVRRHLKIGVEPGAPLLASFARSGSLVFIETGRGNSVGRAADSAMSTFAYYQKPLGLLEFLGYYVAQ